MKSMHGACVVHCHRSGGMYNMYCQLIDASRDLMAAGRKARMLDALAKLVDSVLCQRSGNLHMVLT